jgi:hypothetical protein
MADTRQQYCGYEARRYGPGIKVRRQNMLYWRMGGRAWFYSLRKDGTKRVRFVFDHPMSQDKRRS